MDKKYDILHIGEANHDIRVPGVPDHFFTGTDETGVVGRISDGCGGDAQNQAICTAALGDHCAFYGRLHADYPGPRLKAILEEHGVDTSLTIMAPDCHTSDIIVMILADGSHRFLCGERANWGLRREEIDPDIIASARLLSIGSLFGLDSLDHDGLLAYLLGICREKGVQVVADMNLDVFHLGPRHYDDVYRFMDYLVPSLDEAVYITGEKDPARMADYFLEKGAGHVVIKLGGAGCYARDANEGFYVDPYDIRPVDTTGCGDNFTGGLAHALLKGLSFRECVSFASATAALHATGVGSSGVVRSEQMVLDFMKNTPLRYVKR